MKSLVFSPAAQADMENIWDYTVTHWGLTQADNYTDDIRDACNALASGDRQGRPVDVRPGYLKYLIGSHVVYFRDYATRLEVVRILHNRMDVDRHL
ncbi:MAG: type II toxin-antitoxin system RelE/ParE family toxin [Azoarcus sp.]|jgi:toxin ParE1/3/4|nr:type II toxin-antitoxin system RelE/ParE family toxin [Azoarcus sp.]